MGAAPLYSSLGLVLGGSSTPRRLFNSNISKNSNNCNSSKNNSSGKHSRTTNTRDPGLRFWPWV